MAALGGLLFGYDWVVIGGAKPFYETYFHLTDASQQGWAVSCALIGCLVGAIISGALCDKFGRKLLLLLSALLFAVSSLAIAMTSVFHTFVAWRIAGGIAIGLASNLSPMYIAEIAPAQVRGKLVSVNQLTIVIGILLAQFMNWIIAKPVPTGASALEILNSWNGQIAWRWMFGVTALPSLFFPECTVPESPRWLALAGGESRRILQRLARRCATNAGKRTTLSVNTNVVCSAIGLNSQVLAARHYAGLSQQRCGINASFNYAADVSRPWIQRLRHPLNTAYLGPESRIHFVAIAMVMAGRQLMLFRRQHL